MKKILSLLIVAVLSLLLFACSTNGKEEAEKTVNGFMDAFCEFDTEAMKDYVDDETVVPEEFDNNFDVNKLLENLPAEFADYEDEFEEIISDLLKKITRKVSYEVKEVEEKDGKYIFALDVTVPEVSADLGNVLKESVNSEAITELVVDKFNSGEITETSTEKDIYRIIMPVVIENMKKSLNNIEFDLETKEKELVVFEQDGKWLIDTKASGLD